MFSFLIISPISTLAFGDTTLIILLAAATVSLVIGIIEDPEKGKPCTVLWAYLDTNIMM